MSERSERSFSEMSPQTSNGPGLYSKNYLSIVNSLDWHGFSMAGDWRGGGGLDHPKRKVVAETEQDIIF